MLRGFPLVGRVPAAVASPLELPAPAELDRPALQANSVVLAPQLVSRQLR